MTSNEPDRIEPPSWAGRVAYSLPDQAAYRPGEVLVGAGPEDAAVLQRAAQLLRARFGPDAVLPSDGEPTVVVGFGRLRGSFDAHAAVEVLREERITAQLNNVFFAHCGGGCGGGCPPHPAAVWAWARAAGCAPGDPHTGNPFSGNPFSGNPFSGNPFSGNPFSGNPFSGNPFSGNPFSGNPFSGNPFSGNPFSGNPFSGNPWGGGGSCGCGGGPAGNPFSGNASGSPYGGNAWPAGIDPSTAGPWSSSFAATGRRRSSARPADPTDGVGVKTDGAPVVYIVDSALPPANGRPGIIEACDTSLADPLLNLAGRADADGDGYLDPVSGHGAFGAGLVAQVAPGSKVHVVVAMSNLGDLDEFTVCTALEDMAGQADFVNLSFGSYGTTRMNQLAAAIRLVQTTPCPAAAGSTAPADRRGAVVVASAGNDATCRPAYPAALPGVISVGALAPDGSPAPFTNYGNWVRACAPGVDLVSAFFRDWDGREPATPGWGDRDRFAGGARWSGTSFAAPLVVGRLAREVQDAHGVLLPTEAVTRLIDDPGAPTIPGLGTVLS